jgi:signal transduction histidine kinase
MPRGAGARRRDPVADEIAPASHATIRLRRDGATAEVEVADDGRGRVDRTRGSGLRGLEDRLELDSPPAGGTRLRARVPLQPA